MLYISSVQQDKGDVMYAIGIFVVVVHQVWMALFMYGWLFLAHDPRGKPGQLCLYFFGIFLPTLSSWYVYGACPITELQAALTNSENVGPIQITSFCFVLMISGIALMQILKAMRAWTWRTATGYVNVAGIPLFVVLSWLSFIVYKFGFSSGYTAVSAGIACAALIATVYVKIK